MPVYSVDDANRFQVRYNTEEKITDFLYTGRDSLPSVF